MLHFLEFDPLNTHNPDAPYAVLPVPYERTVSFGQGTAHGPAAILAASVQLELLDEECLRPLNFGVQTLPFFECGSGPELEILARLSAAAETIMRSGRFLLTFGGEHTITAPLVAAARSTFGPLSVLHLDAHFDLRDRYKNNPLSHACVMRRVMDLGLPIVPVGIRSVCAEEYRLVQERSIPVFWARDLVDAATSGWIDNIIAQLTPPVYITVDVDVLDPSLTPGTGTPEPGGLSWYAVTALLRRVCAARRVVAADIVETAPMPGNVVTEYTAARLAAKLMLYHAESNQQSAIG